MNKFSIYQYLLILVILTVGFIYALPNIYPTQPSIQVAYTDSGKSADQALLVELKDILSQSESEYDEIFLRENKIVVKFDDVNNLIKNLIYFSRTILRLQD